MSTLAKAVQNPAESRRRAATAKELLAEIESEIEQRYGTSLAAAKKYLQDTSADVSEADGLVRLRALSNHPTTSHPAVAIKEYATIQYHDDDALDYCRKHLPQALKFNKRTFEKVAKAVPPHFVTIGSEPRATIKRDLSEWLPGGEGDDGE